MRHLFGNLRMPAPADNNRPKAKGIVEMLCTSFGLERYTVIRHLEEKTHYER
jgi:hypothetical protein